MAVDTDQSPLIDLLRFLPDDIRDEKTNSLDEIGDYPTRIDLNDWAVARWSTKREEITLELSGAKRGFYKRKNGQFNFAGIYKRVKKAQKESAAAKAKQTAAEVETNEQRARLVPLFESLCKQVEAEADEDGVAWLDDERSHISISDEGDTDPMIDIEVGAVEVKIMSVAEDIYEFGYLDFPRFTLKEMKKILKTLLEATMRQYSEAP